MTSMRWRAADCSQPMLFVCKVPMQTVRRPPLPQGQQFLVGVCNVYHLPPTDSRAPLAALCVDRRQTRFIIPNIFFVPKGHRQPPIYVDMARLPEQDLPIPSSLLPVGHAEITWSPTGKRYFFTFKKYKGDIRPSIPIIFFARPRPPVGWKWPTKQMNTISPGWKPHGLHYCRMFSIKTTWFQANAVCRMFGGNLASTAYCAERDIVNQRRRQTIWVSRNMDSDRIETPPYDARPLHHGKPSCRKWINGARTVDSENCYEMLPFVCVTRFVPRLKQPLAPFPFSVPFPLPFYVRPLLPLSDGYNPGDSTILEPPIPAAIPSTNNFTPIRLPPVSGYMHTSPGPRVIWPTSRKVPNISLPPSGQTPSPLLPRREPQYLVAVCNVYKVPLMDPRAPYVAFCTDSRQTHFVIPNLFFVPRGQPQPPFYVDMSRMPCQNPNPLLWQSAGYAEITWHTDRKYFLMTFRNTKSEVLPSTWLIFFAKQTRPNGLANQVHTTNAPGWTRFNGNFYKVGKINS
ncbi:unnamed protein product [Nippostrongylus brasiliensis]|uniref:C-type lectin domain-containing protein n=1 Tax=Nippostrongylus brasiliensis TaxID=27835 RepID=A0A0N4XFL4_NIPBR|nr:unnamed protein product [Nippostrongylus brasiliensis]